MDRKSLFLLFAKHSEQIDLNKINTDLIIQEGNEKSFLEKADLVFNKIICNCNTVSDFIVFISKEQIIFFLNFQIWQTSPEGPNNEPPGEQTNWNIKWCTPTSELKVYHDLNKRYKFDKKAWETIKHKAEESLADRKKTEFV